MPANEEKDNRVSLLEARVSELEKQFEMLLYRESVTGACIGGLEDRIEEVHLDLGRTIA